MTERIHHRHRRTGLKIAFGVAVAAFALTASAETARWVMLGFSILSWLSLIVMHRILQGAGRSSGLRPYIVILGVWLVISALILVVDRQEDVAPAQGATHLDMLKRRLHGGKP
jgi:predicted membrane channel-forming protein YqfA (hemolysin III family)